MTTHPAVRLLAALLLLGASSLLWAGTGAPRSQDPIPDGMARFEVVDERGEPVSGAEIHVVAEDLVKEWQLEQRGIDDLDWYTKVLLLGRAYRTDVRGILEIPRWEGRVLVIAHRDSRFFARNFSSGGGPHECPLREVTPLRVRLTDASGAPLVGGEVALRANDGVEEFDLAISPVSGLDNLAHLFGAAEFVEEVEAGYRISVAQVGVFRNVPEKEVDLVNPSDAVTSLVGLPTGSLELELVGKDGRPLVGEIEVRVSAKRALDDDSVPPPPLRRVTDSGRVLVPHVGLGLTLEVALNRPFSDNVTRFEVAGPKSAGQAVAHRHEYRERDVLLMGRVLDPQGQPMVNEYVDVYFRTGNFLLRGEGVQTVRTREDGRIQYPLICRGRDAVQWAEVTFVREVKDLGLRLERAWEVREVTDAGVVQLGDLKLE